ncbi:MAG TPA: cytochrome c oxidase assembly protein [Ideonella sp.]|nr:cytochrome c oxidase assembly protein [Ideonella sp.]
MALALAAAPAHAHAQAATARGLDWDPAIAAWIAGAALVYALGWWRFGAARRARVVPAWRAAGFALGIASLLAALLSPLDALADALFSAHMAQHLVLLLVAPPLLVAGRPWLVWLWAIGLARRRAVGHAFARLRRGRVARAATGPVGVWLMLSFALWFWHLPGPYGWALADRDWHLAEHLCFFLVSIAFWTLVIEPYRSRRRLGYGVTLLYVASIGLQNGLLGALLTFAGHPLYAGHLGRTEAFGLTPLEDQQLAGVIMWVPASAIHLATLSLLFVRWLNAAGAAQPTVRAGSRISTNSSAAVG